MGPAHNIEERWLFKSMWCVRHIALEAVRNTKDIGLTQINKTLGSYRSLMHTSIPGCVQTLVLSCSGHTPLTTAMGFTDGIFRHPIYSKLRGNKPCPLGSGAPAFL